MRWFESIPLHHPVIVKTGVRSKHDRIVKGRGPGAPYHVSPTRVERVSNHTLIMLIMLPLELPHRKRGSSTILRTATEVQDHEDVLYNYALYCLYHSVYATTGYRGNRQPGPNSTLVFATLQRWTTKSGHFPSRTIDMSSSVGFSTFHTPQLSTPF